MSAKPVIDAIASIVNDSDASDMPDIERVRGAIAEATGNSSFEATRPDPVPALIGGFARLNRSELPPLQFTLKQAVQECWTELAWHRSYRHHDDLPDLHAGYFVSAIVGVPGNDEALTFHDEASIYLTIQQPHLLYESHVHKAPELYNVVAGTGHWQKGGRPFEAQPPGTWIVHPTGTRHAMQSWDEPMLSLAIWTDDLTSIPVIVRD